jgi:alkylation response protein AidB-like acyl-CoA dehydrogenase
MDDRKAAMNAELRYQDYSLDDEEEAVRATFERFFRVECPSSRVREAEPVGFDPRLWEKLAATGAVPDPLGGDAGGEAPTLVHLALIAEELGRVLAPVPFISHAVTARLLARVTSARDDGVPAGEPITLAHRPVTGTGRQLVPDAAVCRSVVALVDDELVLCVSGRPAPHARNQGSTPLGDWGVSHDMRRVRLAGGAEARRLHELALREWRLLMAAALVGLVRGALRLAVDFAKTRTTMGVPIGALQGISFQLADVAIAMDAARHLVWRAAWFMDHEPAQAGQLPGLAYAYACRAATTGAVSAVHVQGGLGFTVEADSSLYFRRSKGWSLLGGDPGVILTQAGAQLLAAAGARIPEAGTPVVRGLPQ